MVKTLRDQRALINKINDAYKVGDKLNVRQDNDDVKEWTMKHQATMLGGHTAVIWCDEQSGCYRADRVIFN